jgi:hypothetical protein
MIDMLHEIVIALVTVFALTITIISALSYRKSHNRKVLIVTVCFALFFVKGIVLSLGIFMEDAEWGTLLLLSTIFDLVILVLLFMAIISRK